MIRAIDLCGGGGGWACAARGLPIRIELAVDFWDVACKTYSLNHPQTRVICGDLRERSIQREVLERGSGVDLILGGIPCEWLSVYRKLVKVGADEREQQRLTLDACLSLVKQIDPDWWWIFVGQFPLPPPGTSKQVLADKIRPGPYRIGRRAFDRLPQRGRTFNKTTTLGAWLDRKAPTVLTQCSRRDAELVFVDDSLPGGKRSPEWQEMASLQGFPDDYLFYGSPTDVMKQVGRAVQIDTARAILKAIVDQAETATKRAKKERVA